MKKKKNLVEFVLIVFIFIAVGFVINYLLKLASIMTELANLLIGFIIGCLLIGLFYLGCRMINYKL